MKNKYTLFLLGFLLIFSACETVKREKPQDDSISYQNHSEWSKSAVTYELNIRQFTEKGDFNSIIPHLDRLKNMGVDIIWLMPIHPIGLENRKGGMGSYYSVQNYTEVNPDYGSMEDFKNLVNEIHKRNMFVIIDWVANHTAWDNPWVSEHPDWYTRDSTGNLIPPVGTNWSDVVDLNYENQEMRKGMISALKFWLTETGIDGYRCDVADWVPLDFWEEARVSLDSVKSDLFMLAEAENPKHHIKAFDMSYGWEMHHISNEISKGKMDFDNLEKYMAKEDTNFDVSAYRLNFTSNHDENSWNGTVFERYGDNYKNWAVVMATIDGMPLIYSGQESAMNERLSFFEKDTIIWGDYSLEEFYKGLFTLKDENEALWNGEFGGAFKRISNSSPKSVLTYSRQKDNNKVLIMLNFSDSTETFTLTEEITGEFSNYFSDEKADFNSEISLAAHDYKIFVSAQ